MVFLFAQVFFHVKFAIWLVAEEGEAKASLSEVQSLLRDDKLPVRSSYAAVTSGVGLFATATRLSKPKVEIYKGRREYQLISVHTYIVCTSFVDR